MLGANAFTLGAPLVFLVFWCFDHRAVQPLHLASPLS